jgi:hypothetical protein
MLTNRMCARLCAMFFILLYSSVTFGGPAKVEVCHIPPDNPDNYHTIKISEKALAKHLAHFDLVGSCNAQCDTLCDDGNACTIDHGGNCEQDGCYAGTEPVDCDDSNECTADLCDPVSGCYSIDVSTCEPPAGNLCITSTCNAEDGQCVEANVICDNPDEQCNPDTGICEGIVEETPCPCYSDTDIAAGGGIASCDASDVNTLIGNLVNGNSACTGINCGATAPGCGFLDNQIGGGFTLEGPLTIEQETACLNLIIDNCP